MSEMVERVARAICQNVHGGNDPCAEDYQAARAALEAMREPTNHMLHLADGYTDLMGYHPSCDSTWRKGEFLTAWQVMIDDALGKDAITGEPRHDRL